MATQRIIVAGRKVSDNTPRVMTSPDAITWTEVASWPGGAAASVEVTGDMYFVATGSDFSSNNYAYSFDGDNWTLSSAQRGIFAATWTGNYFVTLGSNASQRSENGISSWSTAVGTGSGSGQVGRRMICRNGTLVGAIGSTDTEPSIVVSSDDGASWTTVDATPGTSGSSGTPWVLFDMEYAAGLFVAVVARPNANPDRWIITSPDGVTWTTVSTGINNQFPYCIRYGNGQFVAVGRERFDPAGRSYTSPDGVNWTMHTSGGLPSSGISQVSELAFWNGRWVWVNSLMGTIYSSTDGANWSGASFTDREWVSVGAGQARRRRGRPGIRR